MTLCLVPFGRGRMRLVPPTSLGVSWESKTYPICGDVYQRLHGMFPDLQVDPALLATFSGIAHHQARTLEIASWADTDGDPRLLPYQRVAVAWLRHVRRGVLADEQGAGKTVMSLAAIPEGARRVLVACSTSKRDEWHEHVLGWTHLTATTLRGDAKTRAGILRAWDGGVLVTNYAALTLHGAELAGAGLDVVIIDEAHIVRNRATNLFKAMRPLLRDTAFIYLLTATLVINATRDLWTLLHLVDPQRWASYWSFAYRFCRVEDTRFGLKVGNILPREMPALMRVLSVYSLQREGLLDLPEMARRTIIHTLPAAQRDVYECMRRDGIVGRTVADVEVAVITRLRQIAVHPVLVDPKYVGESKIDLLPGLVLERDGPVVLFSMFAEAVLLAVAALRAQGISAGALHGALSDGKRAEILSDFHAGRIRCLVMTYGTGGEGLNLADADRVVLLDLPWHHAGVQHAIRRIYRHGQTSEQIEAIDIHARGTVEDHIRDLIRSKRRVSISELARRLLSEQDGGGA